MSNAISVFLVDDHTILRQGLSQLLALDPQIMVVGEAANGQEAVEKVLALRPQVILMDINLPKMSGYEASRAILAKWPQALLLILTNQDDPHIIRQFLELGAKGFLLKDTESDELINAIVKAAQGETVDLDAELQEKVETTQAAIELLQPLTEREHEVLRALAQGYSNQSLAELLSVSPKTVHNHLYNIYSKIGVGSRAEAIVWAIQSGFNH